MIDMRALREDPEPARASQRARGADVELVDRILEADTKRRELLQEFEQLRSQQKEVSRSVGRASKEERPAILAEAKELAARVKNAEAASNEAGEEADKLARMLPNLILPGVPTGGEEDFVVLRHEAPSRVTSRPKDSSRKTTWKSVKNWTQLTSNAAPRFQDRVSTTSRESVRAWSWR